jgi:translin
MEKEFIDIDSKREELIRNSRDVIRLSGQAIIHIHSKQIIDGEKKLKLAEKKLRHLQKIGKGGLFKHISVAEQEFVEGMSLLCISKNLELPLAKKLKISNSSYITGLLDCIGEMKRMVFDKIRQGDISEANNIFDTMQKIYELIFPFAEFDKVIPGIRKKTDVARTLIESVRVTITEESRRNEMIKKLNKK